MSDDVDKIWLKRDEETSIAYEVFCEYRDMGPQRSQRKVIQKLDRSGSWMRKWSSQHDWVERCAAYDKYKDRIRLEAQEKAIRDSQYKLTTESITVLDELLKGIKSGEITSAQQKAIADWLDRAGLKPVDESKISHSFDDEAVANKLATLFGQDPEDNQ